MADFALPTLAIAAAALLLRSASGHLAHRTELRAALDGQDLLAVGLRRLVAALLGPTELGIAVALTIALLTNRATDLAGGLAAGLGAAFLVVLLLLARLRPGAPCGCTAPTPGTDNSVNPVAVTRAGIVFAGGLATVAGAGGRLATLGAAEATTTLVAGAALAAVLDVAARARPEASRPGLPGVRA